MAITDNKKIIIKVCKYYYEDELSQKEISARLSISRPQISRILAYAKENNIVNISINNQFENESKLEYQLSERYGLADVVVIDSMNKSGEPSLDKFAKEVSKQIEAYIPDKSDIGVMSGKTISAVVDEIIHLDRKSISVYPLVGGYDASGAEWHANAIASNLAKKTGGKYYTLNAPAFVESAKVADLLRNEHSIRDILNGGRKCNISIIGIGNIALTSSSGIASNMTEEEQKYLKNHGAVATACTSYIDSNGYIISLESEGRFIGQSLNDLRDSRVVALAMGKNKMEAIIAVLKTKKVDVLFTDLETAKSIINN